MKPKFRNVNGNISTQFGVMFVSVCICMYHISIVDLLFDLKSLQYFVTLVTLYRLIVILHFKINYRLSGSKQFWEFCCSTICSNRKFPISTIIHWMDIKRLEITSSYKISSNDRKYINPRMHFFFLFPIHHYWIYDIFRRRNTK